MNKLTKEILATKTLESKKKWMKNNSQTMLVRKLFFGINNDIFEP